MEYFNSLSATLAGIDQASLSALRLFIRSTQGTLWICGNGGSAATAQHWACDLSKVAKRRTQALGCNPATLTAWSNDVEYSAALAQEFARAARMDDRLICLSCSGQSPNIIEILAQAAYMNLPSAILTGAAWENPLTVPILAICVPSDNYGIIEDCHAAIGHWLVQT